MPDKIALCAILAAAVLCSCSLPDRNTVPATQFQAAGSYDRVASCFARRVADRGISEWDPEKPVLERLSHPDEIRITHQLHTGIFIWEVNFQTLDEARTGIELRFWNPHSIVGAVRRARLVEDLNACGASEVTPSGMGK